MHHRLLVGSTTLAICLAILAWGSDAHRHCGCRSQRQEVLFRRRRTVGDSSDAASSFIKVDDMLIPRDEYELSLSAAVSPSSARRPKDHLNCQRLWPNGKLYYRFSRRYPRSYREGVRRALRALSSMTNNSVEFIESNGRRRNRPSVKVVSSDGCWSHVGRVGRDQEISLPADCLKTHTIQHEFMHALGFYHEHSRSDRDKFVRILWANIESDKCHNFYRNRHIIPEDFPAYDYRSVMHYPSNAFGCGGRNTIVTRNGTDISRNKAVSEFDIAKIQYLYSPGNLEFCSRRSIGDSHAD